MGSIVLRNKNTKSSPFYYYNSSSTKIIGVQNTALCTINGFLFSNRKPFFHQNRSTPSGSSELFITLILFALSFKNSITGTLA